MKRLILISASFMIASAASAQSSQSRCVTAPLSMTGSQVTLTSSGSKSVTKDNTYVYYSRRHHKRHECANPIVGVADKYPSKPILMNSDKRVNALPETYNVSLATPESRVAVCPDSTLNVAATINLEKVSSYTGNYPDGRTDNKTYKKVSKHHYKMIARKMRKIRKNEERVARKTGMDVEAHSSNMNS